MTRDEIREYIIEHGDPEALLFENPDYNSAFVGLNEKGLAVYDYGRMVIDLMENDEMEYEEAVEFIDYNTIRSLPYFENAPTILFAVEIINQIAE